MSDNGEHSFWGAEKYARLVETKLQARRPFRPLRERALSAFYTLCRRELPAGSQSTISTVSQVIIDCFCSWISTLKQIRCVATMRTQPLLRFFHRQRAASAVCQCTDKQFHTVYASNNPEIVRELHSTWERRRVRRRHVSHVQAPQKAHGIKSGSKYVDAVLTASTNWRTAAHEIVRQ